MIVIIEQTTIQTNTRKKKQNMLTNISIICKDTQSCNVKGFDRSSHMINFKTTDTCLTIGTNTATINA